MSPFDLFPLGQPAFVTNTIDRAAHLRRDDDKLMAFEKHPATRAYVVARDSLIVKREGDAVRALLTMDEALGYGANPGTIFLGLRDGAAVFGMGISAGAVEQLAGRNDVAVSELRGMAMQGAVPPDQLATIAMAKSMVSWHQRHGFCANCGTRSAMREGGWKRDCPNCKTEHFPRTDPAVIMLVHHGDKCLLGRGKHFPKGMHSTLAGFVEPGESFEDAVAREVYEEVRVRVKNVTYRSSQPWPFPASVMIGFHAEAESMDFEVNEDELASALWLSREELRPENLPKDGSFFMPRRDSIARRLIEEWLGYEAGPSISG